jgi:Pectate lyase superfamily protein
MRLSRKLQKTLLNLSLSVLVALLLIFAPSITSFAQQTQTSAQKVFPSDFNMRNVKTDYGAKGDGFTDDTGAIQSAMADGRTTNMDYNGKPKTIYFPAGTYLVKDTLEWRGCCLSLQGQGKGISIIRLKDSAVGFSDRNTPKAVIKTPGGNMSFRQNIFDLSVNTGKNNPGAKGIDYIANNTGSIRDVSIVAGDGAGKVGLDMSRQWPGPCLIKNLQVDGFDYGIYTKNAEYSPTFENITLTNQKVVGIRNEGNTLAIRKLNSTNKVPAIQNQDTWGSIILSDSNFQGGLSTTSAIENKGYLYARNVVTQGYQSAVLNKGTVVPGTSQSEYISDKIYSLFDSPGRSLNLPVEETPTFEDSNLANWGKFVPRWYGDTGFLQSLLNSGSSTIYFPYGVYFSYAQKVVNVPATVKRIVGFSSVVNGGGIVFRVEGNSDQPLIIEQFGYGITVEHASARPVVIKHGKYQYSDASGAGKLFLEDVGLRQLIINYPHNIWARQLNIESLDAARTKIENKGGKLWILGLKTEGKGPVIGTSAGGKTELLGSLIYPVQDFTTEEKKQAAFINNESSQSLIYSLSVYGTNKNYDIQVEETRNGTKRQLLSKDIPSRMPLFAGYQK